MRSITASVLRILFRIPFFKKRYFGIYERYILPKNIFKGVRKKIRFKGVILNLEIEDWIQQNIYLLNEYEDAELNLIEKYIRPQSVFIDIGANFGLYSLYIAKHFKTTEIIAFEPYTHNYQAFANNVKLNKFNNITVKNMALRKQDGFITLYNDEKEKNLGMVSTKFIENSISQEVKMTSFDNYFKSKQGNISAVKIDVEGLEYEVLQGMQESINKHKPVILIEIQNKAETIDKIDKLIETLNYKKYFITDQAQISEIETNINRRNFLLLPNHN